MGDSFGVGCVHELSPGWQEVLVSGWHGAVMDSGEEWSLLISGYYAVDGIAEIGKWKWLKRIGENYCGGGERLFFALVFVHHLNSRLKPPRG